MFLVFNWRCWFNPATGGAKVFTREVAGSSVEGWRKQLVCSEMTDCCVRRSVVFIVVVFGFLSRLLCYPWPTASCSGQRSS
jgi:hypothetical protein